MRVTVEGFATQYFRLRRVLEYIGMNLDADVELGELAELACLSPSQLERLYRTKIGETPIGSLRRLRLKRAHEQICNSDAPPAALIDIALAAGYASHAAFTRAFVRQFRHPPSQLAGMPPRELHAARANSPSVRELFATRPCKLDAPPRLLLEMLAPREVYAQPYTGQLSEHRSEIGHLLGNLAVAGSKTWRNWIVLDRDHPLSAQADTHVAITHFVPADGQPIGIKRLDRVQHPGGLYAVHEALASEQPRHLGTLAMRIREELGCELAGGALRGRILLREIRVSGYTAPQERRTALYVPVVQVAPPAKRLFRSNPERTAT
jgi:AraC-like DNA-binding protein